MKTETEIKQMLKDLRELQKVIEERNHSYRLFAVSSKILMLEWVLEMEE
jgi:hypothetical protein